MAPSVVVTSAPSDSETVYTEIVSFSWEVQPTALSYNFQVSTTSDFSSLVYVDSTLAMINIELSSLIIGMNYYWRVRAKNSFGVSPWSEVNLFTTSYPIAIDKTGKEIPETFALFQNYPNPFNPITEIKYSLPTKENVKLVIYNLMGQQVCTMVNEIKQAGQYKIIWDGRDDQGQFLPSGIYIYKMEAGTFAGSKKLLLVK